jgi:hypothetical protein
MEENQLETAKTLAARSDACDSIVEQINQLELDEIMSASPTGLYLNVHGLTKAKYDYFTSLLDSYKLDIIAIAETWHPTFLTHAPYLAATSTLGLLGQRVIPMGVYPFFYDLPNIITSLTVLIWIQSPCHKLSIHLHSHITHPHY